MILKRTVAMFHFLTVLLVLLSVSFCKLEIPFKKTIEHLTAKEGSCITIECTVTKWMNNEQKQWFWIKNAKRNHVIKDFTGTIVNSNTKDQNPAPEFADRVKYIGSVNFGPATQSDCSLLINNLQKTDSGIYKFRYKGKDGKWITEEVLNLTVEDDPCQVSVEKMNPSIVKESEPVTIRCSTSLPCGSYPEFTGLGQTETLHQNSKDNRKSTVFNFNARWQDDGRVLSCQPQGTKDPCVSKSIKLTVEYAPKETKADISLSYVKEGESVTLTCSSRGHPNATYSWFKDSRNTTFSGTEFLIQSITSTQSGNYHCKAVNQHGTHDSNVVTINVKYGPTKPVLSMMRTTQEGHLVSINCTVQSFPVSQLTLTWIPRPSGSPMSSSPLHMQPQPVLGFLQRSTNVVWGSFNVTFLQGGVYTCRAQNSEGDSSTEQELEVTYSPKNVTASAHPDTVLTENSQLVLTCTARSNPNTTTYTWVQISTGETRIVGLVQKLTVMSITPSHSGLYRCTAQNTLGTGQSQQVEVKVKYAPKLTEVIHNMTNRWQGDGESPVALTCHSHSYPPVISYKWYRLVEEREHFIIHHQNITVHPDKPGTYYCVATNNMGGEESERVQLFLNRSVFHVLALILSFCCVPLVLLLIFLVYRHKRNKLIQQGTSNKLPCCVHFGFLGWRNGTNENLVSEGGATVANPPGSSRDQLWPDGPYRPEPLPQPQHPHPSRTSYPDSTSTSDIHTVYSVLKVSGGKQSLSPSHPIRNKDGHTEHTQEHEVNNASLQFRGQEMGSLGPRDQAREDDIYAKDAKPKLKEKTDKWDDYENIKDVCAPKPTIEPNMDMETESSEDDVEISYPEVTFRAKPGHQRVCSSHPRYRRAGHSSSSDEEDYTTQYSDVKI
ncbi:B-cell receptor CD22-like [Coregonus clupeaformis]|uniref:B-cell receptor CD22-like n=1 Tax=Coregonus clupeaformis TaxID=59861 RepID=UPI001E1C63CF|nr:B-cell receptor CD22-like [Coregonus clupeaformis]